MSRLSCGRILKLVSGYLALLPSCCILGPLAAQTGTFVDRQLPTDLRVMSYNVYLDTIFPDVNRPEADPNTPAKFARLVNAMDPDILNLQEVYRDVPDVEELMNNIAPLASGSWYVHEGRANMIVSKYPLSMKRINTVPAASNRHFALALVNLPDEQYGADFYITNNHYLCCGTAGGSQDVARQRQSDANINWLRDARTPGDAIDLPPGTPIAVVGDLNLVGLHGPLDTLISGDIFDEATFGPDSPPDWDGSTFADAHPLHNGTGPDDDTLRSGVDPEVSKKRIDFVLYSDSALDVGNSFVLNTVEMSPVELSATGLQATDVVLNSTTWNYDHLPVVVDFRVFEFTDSDFNFSRSVDSNDLAIWEAGFSASGTSHAEGDADGDGDVDGSDFLRWQKEFAGSSLLDASAVVPEPTTLVIALVVLTLAQGRSQSRNRDIPPGTSV